MRDTKIVIDELNAVKEYFENETNGAAPVCISEAIDFMEKEYRPDSYWIKKKVDYRHYHYFCSKCGCCSKYKKSNYCPDCGRKMQKGEEE